MKYIIGLMDYRRDMKHPLIFGIRIAICEQKKITVHTIFPERIRGCMLCGRTIIKGEMSFSQKIKHSNVSSDCIYIKICFECKQDKKLLCAENFLMMENCIEEQHNITIALMNLKEYIIVNDYPVDIFWYIAALIGYHKCIPSVDKGDCDHMRLGVQSRSKTIHQFDY
jgi:hypothetical protein